MAAALPEDTIEKLWPILQNQPTNDKYEHLKAALLKRFTPSQFARDCQILALPEIDDARPTNPLAHILALNSDPHTLWCAVFLRKLPSRVRTDLASRTDLSLEDLAQEADALWESERLEDTHPTGDPPSQHHSSPAHQP